ncbi:MAG: hypothetical protein H6Q68_3227 [Firmicutes bacterium]|nr:hypothetical protein [Bacillota bacterium]
MKREDITERILELCREIDQIDDKEKKDLLLIELQNLCALSLKVSRKFF